MKKLVLPFLLITLFFIKTETANAVAAYTYDVNSVNYSSATNSLTIEGWAFISNNDRLNVHNIQPKYTLKLEGRTKDGRIVGSKVYDKDIEDKPAFSEPDATPHDFTKAYFIKHTSPVTGVYLTYPDPVDKGKRADAILNSDPSYGNVFAINIDFKFAIPVGDLIDLAKKGSEEIYMYLTSTLTGQSAIQIYGKKFNTITANGTSQTIKLAILSNRIKNLDKPITATVDKTTYTINIGVGNLTDSINNIAVLGQGRASWDLDFNTYWFLKDGELLRSENKFAGTPVYYYNVQQSGESLSKYKVISQENVPSLWATGNDNWSYKVYIYHSPTLPNCFDKKRCIANGGSSEAWIPSYWARPFQGKGSILTVKINDNTCTLKPECATDKLGTGSTCPVYDSSNPANSECCKTICSISANKNTNFCTNVCKSNPIPNVPSCASLDPEQQYCCKYPDDDVCKPKACNPSVEVCDSFPGTDEPENKSETCTDTGTTSINFKYPSEGWGKTLLTNNACSISCQETLRATFNPKISVKAGMGFAYPVNMKSSRYCTAKYDNDGWKKKVEDKATAANDAYKKMTDNIDNAKSLDSKCGTKATLRTSVPSCPSPYTDGRSGLTCTCKECKTCYRSQCPSVCDNLDCTKTPCVKTKYPCMVDCDPYKCGDSTSVSCPSIEGIATSYNSSNDTCEVDVCSNDHSKLWSTAQAGIATALKAASDARAAYNNYTSAVNVLYGERSTCDNYVSTNTYSGASGTTISVNVPNQDRYTITETSRSEDTNYENSRKSTSTNYSIYQCNNRPYYTAPTLVGDHSANSYSGTYCNFQTATKTYKDFWNKKSDANLTLEFSQGYYVQQYTGNLSTSGGAGYDYDGRKAYTDFYDYSGINDFSLSLTKLGPNLPTISNNLWSIDPFTCQYDTTNWIFPPSDDPRNSQYSKVAFMYRQISLVDPFPNRNPGENWRGYVSLITSKGYSIYDKDPLYTITLNPQSMQGIRDYNRTHSYGSFNPSHPYKSDLIHNISYWGIFVKERSGS